MTLKEIVFLVESMILPLTENLDSHLSFNHGTDLRIRLSKNIVDVMFKSFTNDHIGIFAQKNLTLVQSTVEVKEDTINELHNGLLLVIEKDFSKTNLVKSRKDQITKRIEDLKKELAACQ